MRKGPDPAGVPREEAGEGKPSGACRIGFPVFVGLFLVVALLRKIDDYDIWYHLAIGRRIFETLQIPDAEFLVYTLKGTPTAYHEWGFGVLFYAVFRALGDWGISLLNAAIGGGTMFLLFRAAGEGDRRPGPVPLLVLCGVFWCITFRLIYRPEMILFLCLAAQILFLERYDATRDRRWLAAVPPLAFLLNNFHPSALFLLFVLSCYGVRFLLDAPARGGTRKDTLLLLLAVGAAAFLASGLNPYGFRQTVAPLEFAKSLPVFQKVSEFFPARESRYWWPYLALLAASATALVLRRGRRAEEVILFAAFGWLAYRHVRNLALFAIVMYLPVTRAADAALRRLPRSAESLGNRILWGAAAAGLAAMLAFPAAEGKWGAGTYRDAFPVESARLISAANPPGRVFNIYQAGGFLAWRLYGKYEVSIDGRHYGLDRSLLLHDNVFKAEPGWQQTLAAYDVNVLVMPVVDMYTGLLVPLVPVLSTDAEWVLAAAEPGGLTFIRRSIVPLFGGDRVLDKRRIWVEAEREAAFILARNPLSAGALRTAGRAYFELGDYGRSADALRRYVKVFPEDRDAVAFLRLLESYNYGR